jgi:hypothetical protein
MLDGSNMSLSEEQRLARNAYMRGWKQRSKEKVNAINLRVKAKRPAHYREINRRSMAKQRAEDPARFTAHARKQRVEQPALYLWNHARKRALLLGVAFDLEVTDISVPEFCPVLGLKLEWGFGQRASANRSAPSLDRMHPAKGYTKGNVYVISNRANHLKNNGSLVEFEQIVAYMRGAL